MPLSREALETQVENYRKQLSDILDLVPSGSWPRGGLSTVTECVSDYLASLRSTIDSQMGHYQEMLRENRNLQKRLRLALLENEELSRRLNESNKIQN